MRKRNLAISGTVISLLLLVPACRLGAFGPPNTIYEIAVVNDQPNRVAIYTACYPANSPIFNGACIQHQIGIDSTGKGDIRIDVGVTGLVNISGFVCGSGTSPTLPPGFTPISLSSNPKRTVDCQFNKPIPSSTGWESLDDSLDKIHLDQNPQLSYSPPLPYEASSASPYDETNREAVVRSFLTEHNTNVRQANVLYDWLLNSTPPDSTVLQNLDAGASTESQIAYIVAGPEFLAASSNDFATFTRNVYRALLDRDPAQWEIDSAVQDLNGYWVFIEQECQPNCFWIDGYYYCDEKQPPPPCGHWEWYQKSPYDLAWEVLSSHEFHQVAARFMHGIQLRRDGSSSEIETQAFHIAAYGLKEGAVRLAKSAEYFDKSIRNW